MRIESLPPDDVADPPAGDATLRPPQRLPTDQRQPPAPLIDRYGRQVSYIRLSITDRCDFRCNYCMAEEMEFLPRAQVLTLEECLRVASTFVELGVNKVRITGGEPLVRHNVVWLLQRIARLPGLRELVMTSNGSQLERFAPELRAAGVRRINISLDTLQPERFRQITRVGDLAKVLRGLDAAQAAGFDRLKINTVMIRNVNDDELIDLVDFAVGRASTSRSSSRCRWATSAMRATTASSAATRRWPDCRHATSSCRPPKAVAAPRATGGFRAARRASASSRRTVTISATLQPRPHHRPRRTLPLPRQQRRRAAAADPAGASARRWSRCARRSSTHGNQGQGPRLRQPDGCAAGAALHVDDRRLSGSAAGSSPAGVAAPPSCQSSHDNSAMDGYGLRGADLAADGPTTLEIVGTAYAGQPCDASVGPGQAVRIMTGARLPAGVDTVVMQEVAHAEGGRVTPPGPARRPEHPPRR
jgi:pyruvate-formate lyase-activating enzyme